MPNWLDGRTIAVMTTTITVALALGTMLQTTHSSLRNDIQTVRTELSNDINKLDDRLRSVEVGIATIQTAMAGFDARLRVVERHAGNASDGGGG